MNIFEWLIVNLLNLWEVVKIEILLRIGKINANRKLKDHNPDRKILQFYENLYTHT